MNKNGAMTTNEILFALLRSELCSAAPQDVGRTFSDDTLRELYRLSDAHDLAHMVANALHKAGCLSKDEISQKFLKKRMMAIYRREQLNYALSEICAVFDKEKIPYIPLKGSVLRSYYPEEWMRTSCDIDILVHEEDLHRAVAALVENNGYKADGKENYHDVSLFSKTGVHLELHFHIKENMENIDGLLSQVWAYAEQKTPGSFRYELTGAYFVFHHIAHMSYHFLHGGCGIKPFVDLHIIKNKLPYEDDVVRSYCRQCGLEDFYSNVLYAAEVWFGDKAHSPISQQIEEYILQGGVYGTLENRIVVAQSEQGGKTRYALSRVFLPYKTLKIHYPILERHPWLVPFMQARRWFGIVFCGKLRRSIRELTVSQSTPEGRVSEMRSFLEHIGLKRDE